MYTKHKWNSDKHFNFGYIQYLPPNFDPSRKYPLIFFLHGAGERGDDLERTAVHGYMKCVREQGREYPFILIAPQCPQGKYWGCYTESLIAFLEEMIATLPVDESRVYLTGYSMGGTGTWMLAMACPEKFAAIAPVCGSGIYWFGEVLTDIPIYAYHGDCDAVVPVNESVNMVSVVNRLGGNAKLKICYGRGHNTWEDAYENDELLNWLLKIKKDKAKEVE